jgi:hypothetical protein
MRTTLNIEDSLIDKAAKLTGITEKNSSRLRHESSRLGIAY